jgi:transcriptional regulator with XRE-family HTH domain
MERGMYNIPLDYRYIKQVRFLRNKTLSDFSKYMNVDPSTIAKLEKDELAFSPYYESKLRGAIYRLRVSNVELNSISKILEMKALRLHINIKVVMKMLNEHLVRALANGDAETLERVNKLPVSMRMAYGIEIDELRRQENIVPMTNGLELYVQPNKTESEENGVGEAFKRILDERKAKEAEAEKQRKAHIEAVAQNSAQPAHSVRNTHLTIYSIL